MLRRAFGAIGATAILFSLSAGMVLAGQPGAECGDPGATLSPPGFDSPGFAKAETHYAGSDGTHSLVSGNGHAVSQYDIACVHYTAAHS
jgi:hypothetical protein